MVTSLKGPDSPGRSAELSCLQVTLVVWDACAGLGKHLGLGVQAEPFRDVLRERDGQLAGAAA
jgi:hypothetical protein